MKKLGNCIILILLGIGSMYAQGDEDLLSLLEEEPIIEFTKASFKTTRVVNLHSLESLAPGVLDIKISHRFGFLNSGAQDLFGLDDATIRLGADLGLTNHLMIGFGRSSFEKTFDGFIKFKLLRQSTGKRKMPFTFALFASTAIRTDDFLDDTRDNFFSSRVTYAFQAILGRKFSEGFSLELVPTLIHRNLVTTTVEDNDVFGLGIGVRQKLTKRITINAEYIYVPEEQLTPDIFENSLSIGFDIETGGHVFQVHLTNSTSIIEKGFVAETVGSWTDMGIHIGFNIARVFTAWNRRTPK